MPAAGDGGWRGRDTLLASSYGTASLILSTLYPFLPSVWAGAALLLVSIAAAAGIAYGRRSVRSDRRRPWTLLLWALVAFVAANLVRSFADDAAIGVSWLLDATGNLLLLAAALTMILRRSTGNLGGVIDAAVIALAAGSLLWVLLPHRLGPDQSLPAQLNLFVVVFALTGVLGALLRLARTTTAPSTALWWLLPAIGLSIAGNVVLSVAASVPGRATAATVCFLAATTATGLFGLDPTGARLAEVRTTSPERLSAGRLAFLSAAVAVIPIVVGTREQIAGDAGGLLLAAQGALIAAFVMARISLLAAQRTRAEQALEDQATRDPLTHLLNRREFVTRLRGDLDEGARCVILFCDLDGFKPVNDRFGHEIGDALLIEVAHRLSECVDPPHVVSRFGGDEFVVLLVDASPALTYAIRDRISAAVQRPFPPAAGIEINVSIGLAYTDSEPDPDRLIRSADRDMYRVKAARRGARSRAARPSSTPTG